MLISEPSKATYETPAELTAVIRFGQLGAMFSSATNSQESLSLVISQRGAGFICLCPPERTSRGMSADMGLKGADA